MVPWLHKQTHTFQKKFYLESSIPFDLESKFVSEHKEEAEVILSAPSKTIFSLNDFSMLFSIFSAVFFYDAVH